MARNAASRPIELLPAMCTADSGMDVISSGTRRRRLVSETAIATSEWLTMKKTPMPQTAPRMPPPAAPAINEPSAVAAQNIAMLNCFLSIGRLRATWAMVTPSRTATTVQEPVSTTQAAPRTLSVSENDQVCRPNCRLTTAISESSTPSASAGRAHHAGLPHESARPVPMRDDGAERRDRADAPAGVSPELHESPQSLADQLEAPHEEAPQLEAPQEDAPHDDAPQLEAPQEDAPQDEAPQLDAPQLEAPQLDAPHEEASKLASPVVSPLPSRAAPSASAQALVVVLIRPAPSVVLPLRSLAAQRSDPLTCAGEAPGLAARKIAATPEVTAAAWLVPDPR